MISKYDKTELAQWLSKVDGDMCLVFWTNSNIDCLRISSTLEFLDIITGRVVRDEDGNPCVFLVGARCPKMLFVPPPLSTNEEANKKIENLFVNSLKTISRICLFK